MTEPFWTKDPSILFSAGTWQKFVPTKDMDVPSALNSVVRFSVYFSVILYAGTFAQPSEIYMDTSDRFDQVQAMRTFHTMQSATIPNDQDGFLKFMSKGMDEMDTSSTFPARNAKIKSESYVHAAGTTKNLPNSIDKPTGTRPASSSFKTSA
jgi:hypothetical protein